MLESVNKLFDFLKSKAGIRIRPHTLAIFGIIGLFVSLVFVPAVVTSVFSFVLFFAPVWLPILLIGGAWKLWITLRQSEFIEKQKIILLEIKPPRNLVKTPLAMETFLQGIHHSPGEGTWYARSIMGKVRPWWSLELVSSEGRVHFYIWTRAGFRRIVESQMYAQYPGVQIIEVPDYTRLISATPEEWTIWGCDFTHTDKDPLPIKTYVEYGLDKVQKEPEQVDPLSNLIEFMGALSKGEHLWLQIIIRVHKGEKYGKLNDKGKPYTWKDEAKELIEEIRKKTRDVYIDPTTGEERPGFPNPTKGQTEIIAAIERNVSKISFDVGIRGIYLSKPDKFDPINISGLTGIFKQFSSEVPGGVRWNGFRSKGWMTEFDDYPWEIGTARLKNKYRRKIVDAYRRRQFFYAPYRSHGMVMSTEELATIYHIPSRAIESPSLERIQSATANAPSNLPT